MIKNYFFGKVVCESVKLSEVGKIAVKYWQEIPAHFSNVEIDEFIIMPNHVHGIIVIKENVDAGRNKALPCSGVSTMRTGQCPAPTRPKIIPNSNAFQNIKPGSLSAIIGSYKSVVSKICHQKNGYKYFNWQPCFYDHIIRTDKSLENIRHYIRFNVYKWGVDENNPENIKHINY